MWMSKKETIAKFLRVPMEKQIRPIPHLVSDAEQMPLFKRNLKQFAITRKSRDHLSATDGEMTSENFLADMGRSQS